MRFRYVIIFLNCLYDIYKILKKKNISWKDSYENRRVYNYSDFVFKDLINVDFKMIPPFLVTLKIVNLVLTLQCLITIIFFVFFKINGLRPVIKRRGLFWDLFVNNPKVVAFTLVKFLKIRIILNKNIFKSFLVILNNILIWGSPKISIEYSLIVFRYINNWVKKYPKKKNFINTLKMFDSLVKNKFTEKIKDFENTL